MDSKDLLDVVIDLAPRVKYRKDLLVYGAHQHHAKEWKFTQRLTPIRAFRPST